MSSKTFSKCSSGSPNPPGQDQDSSLSLNLDILKSLSDKKTTREGNPPKRRGPKPDSKPALTRRQELNRQAQRTHRERKELYIKALEDEVLRLKEIYTTSSQAREKLAEENRHLREALRQNGIPFTGSILPDDAVSSISGGASVSGHSHGTAPPPVFTPGMVSHSSAPSASPPNQPPEIDMMDHQIGNVTPQGPDGKGVDFEQAGIDFVLTLEKPCMVHMPLLLDRAAEADGGPCGHALMATCPPQPFDKLSPATPFERPPSGHSPSQHTWELSKSGLSVLMDLSKRLNLEGEITPVMAWSMIAGHDRFYELHQSDFIRLAEELTRKVRCYGFGAVMEEFEVRDALEGVLSIHSRPCLV